MKRLIIEPHGWPCKFKELPVGLFVFDQTLCVKNEYGDDPVICDSGEYFWGGTSTKKERDNLEVQPCLYTWEEVEGYGL